MVGEGSPLTSKPDHLFMIQAIKVIIRLFCAALAIIPPDASRADQWGSMITAQCFALKDSHYDAHLAVRIFWTELGGGQLWSGDDRSSGLLSLGQLAIAPVTCPISGKAIRLETSQYSAPQMHGYCGLCEQTGFRLIVDEKVLWKIAAPAVRGDPIFNGTIDVDRDMARVCTEHRPEDLGVVLPFEQDFFSSRASMLICQTFDY